MSTDSRFLHLQMIPTRLMILVILVAFVFPAVAFELGNLTYYSGIPAYCLIVDSANPVVDTGDEFDVKVYISGAGDVDCAQISISIPNEIVKDNKVLYSYIHRLGEEGIEYHSETSSSRFIIIPSLKCL